MEKFLAIVGLVFVVGMLILGLATVVSLIDDKLEKETTAQNICAMRGGVLVVKFPSGYACIQEIK